MGLFKRKREQETESDDDSEVDFVKFMGEIPAMDIRLALLERKWEIARDIFHNAATPEHFSYYVVKAADTRALQDWIDGPIRDEPHSTLPLLIKGARMVYWAWDSRGSGTADTVSRDIWKIWFERLKVAEDCLDEVVEREPANVEAWHWLIMLARAREVSKEELWRRFNALVAINPAHYYGHTQMLEALMPKWSGSVEEMFAFARDRAAAAPGTAIPSLVLDAHLEYGRRNGGTEYYLKPEVSQEILEVAEQSIFHPSFQRSLLTPMLWNRFALMFADTKRYVEADRCFEEIGDDFILEDSWVSIEEYMQWREYCNYYARNG